MAQVKKGGMAQHATSTWIMHQWRAWNSPVFTNMKGGIGFYNDEFCYILTCQLMAESI